MADNCRFLTLNVCVYVCDVSELLGDSLLDDKWWWVIEWLSQLRDNKSYFLTKLIMKIPKYMAALPWDSLKFREDWWCGVVWCDVTKRTDEMISS